MNKLHPGAKWSFRFGAYLGMIFLSFFAAWFIFPLLFVFLGIFGSFKSYYLLMVVVSVLIYAILIVIVGEIYARMAYARWFWEFNDEGLRLERGVIWKRYSNVPYERIQNVDVSRGILARMFGFSSLMIQTAGYSAQAGAEGYIPAVDMKQAEQIREFVMKKITKRKK